jgi:hypothetical protein
MAAGGTVPGGGAGDPGDASYAQYQAIRQFYQQYLGRTASDQEILGWINTGMDLNAIEDHIKTSPEAQQHGAGAGAGAGAGGGAGAGAGGGPPSWTGRSTDRSQIGAWLKWLATQPNTDPILKSQQGIDYYTDRIIAKGGLGSDNTDWWQNKGTLAEFGGGVGAPDGGGGGGGSMAVDPSYLKPFTGTFGDAWSELYGSPWDASQQPHNFEAPNAQTIANDPGYKFRVSQATGGLQNQAAAKGLLNSGGTLYDLLGLEDQFAGQEYQNAWGRNFSKWQQDWSNYGSQFSRAWQQYAMDKDTWYQNENNPWSKLYQAASLGAGVAGQ